MKQPSNLNFSSDRNSVTEYWALREQDQSLTGPILRSLCFLLFDCDWIGAG
jgi:hypothetical protein